MKRIAVAVLAGILAGGLTGCTYADPGQEQELRQAESPATLSTPSARSKTLVGTFQSQAVSTTGTATVEVNESGAILQLENMATGPGDDLRVMLSPGTLTPGAGGVSVLSSTKMLEVGPFRAGATQPFVMDSQAWDTMPEPVLSVVIYNYATKTAYGTANLSAPLSSPRATSVNKG
ncbi:DM13 domain-containing protein [Arthrobacter sp. Cr_A7]|uniref:DM13 domain-containing protein n=1 Tax=Arthrobacter sp. Cr_A7 TaxID=3031017 RepID=UPI0023DC14CB|nr:DM13 domain-containing protein [Arthrobacter sp. Cr_A7]MDF2050247.1 DM13 domain-containing protein [Arthrobacter sp. Cr_A7]